jgi:hypothetical protein
MEFDICGLLRWSINVSAESSLSIVLPLSGLYFFNRGHGDNIIK